MSKWFYTKNGKNFGPVSENRLADTVLRGELDMDASVMSATNGLWQKIRDIPEVMEIIHKPLSKPIFNDVAAEEFKEFIQAGVELSEYHTIYYNLPAKTLLRMMLITGGLFEIYWFYKQWMYYIAHTKRRRGNFFRAMIYFPLFAFEMFKQIDMDKDLNRVKRAPWDPMKLALLWYLVIPGLVFNPFGRLPVISGLLGYLMVFLATSFVLLPVQRYINDCNEALKRPVSKPTFGFYFVTLISVFIILSSLYALLRSQF